MVYCCICRCRPWINLTSHSADVRAAISATEVTQQMVNMMASNIDSRIRTGPTVFENIVDLAKHGERSFFSPRVSLQPESKPDDVRGAMLWRIVSMLTDPLPKVQRLGVQMIAALSQHGKVHFAGGALHGSEINKVMSVRRLQSQTLCEASSKCY